MKTIKNKRIHICKKCIRFFHPMGDCSQLMFDSETGRIRTPISNGWCTRFYKNKLWWVPMYHNLASAVVLVYVLIIMALLASAIFHL